MNAYANLSPLPRVPLVDLVHAEAHPPVPTNRDRYHAWQLRQAFGCAVRVDTVAVELAQASGVEHRLAWWRRFRAQARRLVRQPASAATVVLRVKRCRLSEYHRERVAGALREVLAESELARAAQAARNQSVAA